MRRRLTYVFLVLVFSGLFAITAKAQLSEDPTTLPLPNYPYSDPDRALVIKVIFNSETDLELDELMVANTRAKSAIGAPAMLILETLNAGGDIISRRNSWHPLVFREWNDESDDESSRMLESGEGTFYVPLTSDAHSIRIIDPEGPTTLLLIDISAEVLAYCTANRGSPICSLFSDGFE